MQLPLPWVFEEPEGIWADIGRWMLGEIDQEPWRDRASKRTREG